MNEDKFIDLIDRKSHMEFDATREQWLVMCENLLQDGGFADDVRCFGSKKDAIRYA